MKIKDLLQYKENIINRCYEFRNASDMIAAMLYDEPIHRFLESHHMEIPGEFDKELGNYKEHLKPQPYDIIYGSLYDNASTNDKLILIGFQRELEALYYPDMEQQNRVLQSFRFLEILSDNDHPYVSKDLDVKDISIISHAGGYFVNLDPVPYINNEQRLYHQPNLADATHFLEFFPDYLDKYYKVNKNQKLVGSTDPITLKLIKFDENDTPIFMIASSNKYIKDLSSTRKDCLDLYWIDPVDFKLSKHEIPYKVNKPLLFVDFKSDEESLENLEKHLDPCNFEELGRSVYEDIKCKVNHDFETKYQSANYIKDHEEHELH